MNVGLVHYLALSAILFCLGLYGVLSRRNAVVILMCLEIMLNAANIALIAFSRFVTPLIFAGQVFALFVMVVAAAEVAVGLAIILNLYRRRKTVDATEVDLLKG